MVMYDKSHYYVDFSNNKLLSDDEKIALERIQDTYRPVERVELLLEYKVAGKITADEFETMTGLPYNFGMWYNNREDIVLPVIINYATSHSEYIEFYYGHDYH